MVTSNNVDPIPLTTRQHLNELLTPREGPCISIYMATNRYFHEADENRLRFRELLKEVDASLAEHWPRHSERDEHLMDELRKLDDMGFWRNQKDGLAIFRAPNFLRVHRLLRPTPNVTVVADSFHLKPMIRVIQDSGRYQVLCFSLERVALFEGNRFTLEQVAIPNLPHSIHEGLPGEPIPESPESDLEAAWKDQRKKKWIQQFIQIVDSAVWDFHSRFSKLPLILAALPEYHGFFHELTRNKNLLEQGIERDPFKAITKDELRDLAWKVVEPVKQQEMDRLINIFREAKSHHQGSDDVRKVAEAAVQGRIRYLLLEEDRHIGGQLDPRTGEVKFKDIQDPATDDLLDDIAERVFRTGDTQVLVVPSDQMPTNTGVAAIERFEDPAAQARNQQF